MAGNPEIAALWREMPVDADGKYVPAHRDGRPFTAAEIEIIRNATAEDIELATTLDTAEADRLDATRRDLERLQALVATTGHSNVSAAITVMGIADQAEARALVARLRAAGMLPGRGAR
ncbi:MAG: hypothetical protein ACYCVZ_04700 [Streptosporangiaceae bacterium]